MSLLKQLFLAICLFLVVAFSGSFVSSVENSREQLRGQLRSHAQDAATALGLSLTPHVDDPAMVQLMVSSIFDSGYFASIRVIDIKSGKPLVERVQAHAERTVPGWFERLVDLQPQGGDALIMRGWEQAARVEVVSHPQFALARLWDSALGSLYWLLACGAVSLLLGGWLLRRQLRPLDQMVRQAHAISRREFLSLPRLPRTPELRRVVQAMNQMVEKLRTLFAEEAARSDKLRAQAYQDSLTGLPNRRLFDARLNEQLGAGEHEHAGQLLLLRLNDLNGLNQRLGGQRTDELIQAVARLLVDSCGQQGRADWLLARSRGGEFAVLAPGCSREQAERLAEELCEGLENLARTGASDLTPVAYLGISAFAEGDSPADLLARRGFYRPDDLQVFTRGQRGGAYWFEHGWNWRGMGAWIPSAAAGLAFVNLPGQFVGPLGELAGGIDLSLPVALGLAALLYLALLRLFPEPPCVYGPRGPRWVRAHGTRRAPAIATA
ncbi:LapD/MoxY N-terminal periplasmic domain-containing protein [Pseudomonas aeruginosa]